MAYDRYLHVSSEHRGGFSYIPHIRLKGKWLEKAGFKTGDIVKVQVSPGKLNINNETEYHYSPPDAFSNKTESLEEIVVESEPERSVFHNGYKGYTVSLQLIRENGYRPVHISTPLMAYNFLNSLQYESREILLTVMLDAKNQVVGVYDVGKGGRTSVTASPSEAIKAAIMANSTGLILAHNHPSGDTTPSNEDIQLTERVDKAASLMDMRLLDHIIIGNNHYSSMKELGYLNAKI